MIRTVGIFAFDQHEALDFAGPYEVFTCASRVHRNMHPGSPALFKVLTIAQQMTAQTARAGLRILPDVTIADAPALDVLIVPGGVVSAELAKPDVIAWIADIGPRCELLASVCTGAMILAKAGLLDGKQATTHRDDIAEMRDLFPNVEVLAEQRWVEQGKIVTSAGISAGIDMALHLVERLAGRELALRTAWQMEYRWGDV